MDIRYSKRRKPTLFFLLLAMSLVTNLGSLIHPLPRELRKEVRDLEKVSFRRCKSECSLLFNSVCVKENLLPNFTNIYIYQYIYILRFQSGLAKMGPHNSPGVPSLISSILIRKLTKKEIFESMGVYGITNLIYTLF